MTPHIHSGDKAAHPQGQILSLYLTVVSSAPITELYFKALFLSLSSLAVALALADRSEVADQSGHLCVI